MHKVYALMGKLVETRMALLVVLDQDRMRRLTQNANHLILEML